MNTGQSGQGQALTDLVTGRSVWTREQSWVYIIFSNPEVQQMGCRDLSIGVVSEPGVPGGFSASLEVGQGRVHFQILCQGLIL